MSKHLNHREFGLQICCGSVLVAASLIFLIPFIVILSTSFVSESERALRGALILIPQKLDVSAYKMLLGSGTVILNAYKITLFRVVMGTLMNLFFTALLAYGISKSFLPGMKFITGMVFFTMLFGGGLIPNYLVVTALGMKNSLWSLILPGLISTWNMLIMRNFFMQIPASLEESATVDGAGSLRILFFIVLPLSLPSIATIGLFYAVGHWNAWFDAAIYLNDESKMPIQIILRKIVVSATNNFTTESFSDIDNIPPPQTIRAATIIVTTVPILFVYPFLQKYFVKGMLVGSVKG